jgi:hypothetical protein
LLDNRPSRPATAVLGAGRKSAYRRGANIECQPSHLVSQFAARFRGGAISIRPACATAAFVAAADLWKHHTKI